MQLVPEADLRQIAKKRGGKLRFPIYLNDKLMETDLEALDLSVRSSNCLHRAGYKTIGQLVDAIESSEDLKKIRNCGAVGISEYGWGANTSQHEAYPVLGENNLAAWGHWHLEEYQSLMNEEAVRYINGPKEIWGTFYWVMFDFAVDARNEGSQIALNDKGLVTADRQIKKDSYYLYKANWNKKDFFVYITSRRWTKRIDAETYIKVYSNCDAVEVFVNGERLGQMESKGNGVFLKEGVTLVPGSNEVRAVGNGTVKALGEGCSEAVKEACTCEDNCVWELGA